MYSAISPFDHHGIVRYDHYEDTATWCRQHNEKTLLQQKVTNIADKKFTNLRSMYVSSMKIS